MKIILQATHFKLDDAISDYIYDKIGGLETVLGSVDGPEVEARVEVGITSKHHRKGDIYRAEVNLKVSGKLLRAESINWDLRLAITEVKDELQRQIRKYKEKNRDNSRRNSIKDNEFSS